VVEILAIAPLRPSDWRKGRKTWAVAVSQIISRLPDACVRRATSSLLKFVASAGQARRKPAKKRNVWGNHEHFEPLANAASPAQQNFN
jgi:acyl-CoA hydrolase